VPPLRKADVELVLLSTRIWIECEHCGFKDMVSNTPVSGANSDSMTRKMPLTKA